jgi:uncharacterized membrane protein YjfL (UPF0719 family)
MKELFTNLAVTLVDGGTKINNVPALSSEKVLQNTLNIVYMAAGIAAVIVIIVGAIIFASSAGNSSSVVKGKNMVVYAVVGLVVVIAAFAITNYVIGAFK